MIKNIALIPSINAFYNNQIFEKKFENDGSEPFAILKQKLSLKKVTFNTIDFFKNYNEFDLLIVLRHENNINIIFDVISKNKKVKILYISTEEISVAPTQKKELLNFGLFDRILTWRDNEVDLKLFFKYHYMTPQRSFVKRSESQRRLVCIINAFKKNYYNDRNNIYSERIKVISFFEDKKNFSLYGHNWHNYDSNIKNYRGSVSDKINTYLNYDFSFIFENSNSELGGISEKIWDSMAAGCIPIYFGAPNVSEYIPGECYIDYRQFNNLLSLEIYLQEMSIEEKRVRRKAIELFLNSKDYNKFTSIGFSDNMILNIKDIDNLLFNGRCIFKIKFKLLNKLIKNKISLWQHKRFYFKIIVSKYF